MSLDVPNDVLIHVKVRLFGSLRSRTPEPLLSLSLRAGARVSDLLAALGEKLPEASELSVSAVADESRVLLGDELVRDKSLLAVLPPVCGG